MSAANRRRGHDAERAVVKWLKANGYPDARTTRAMLGHDGATAPGDVWAVPGVVIEVKDVAASAWPSWRKQALTDADGRFVPVVVRRTRGEPDVGMWTAEMPADECVDWMTSESGWWVRETVCPRTGLLWVRGPFLLVVEALR